MHAVRISSLHSPRRSARWLVLLTLALALLAPTLSQALALARGEVVVWSQICRSSQVSPRASELVLAKLARSEPRDIGKHGLLEHCPFCAQAGLGQDLAPPPAKLQDPQLLSGLSFAMPARFYSAPGRSSVWAPAQSRAPPLSL